MSFNSFDFILLFWPIVCILYYFPTKHRRPIWNVWILILTSLAFYWISDGILVAFLIGTTLVNYAIYHCIQKYRRKALLIGGIIFNVLLLVASKYVNFGIDLSNRFLGTSFHIVELIVPLGISFITFQNIAFLVDSYKNPDMNVKIAEFGLFSSFFPHVTSGPILSSDFIRQIKNLKVEINWENIAQGIFLFVLGLSKKTLLGDALGKAVDMGYSLEGPMNTATSVFVIVAYTLQIYFDFSGYCDMAMGIAKTFNFELPLNFDSPYRAIGIGDFWNRWHITLTKFFTRYVYIPLGGNRKGKLRTCINTMIVFLISGLWHGASILFAGWGLLHGLFMVFEKMNSTWINRIPKAVRWLLTFVFVNLTWVLFRSGSFGTAVRVFEGLLNPGRLSENVLGCFNDSFIPESYTAWGYLIIGFIISVLPKNGFRLSESNRYGILRGCYTLILLLMCVFSFSDVTTYIYAMF